MAHTDGDRENHPPTVQGGKPPHSRYAETIPQRSAVATGAAGGQFIAIPGEDGMRQGRIVWLGILLVIGALIPLPHPAYDRPYFVNFEVLAEPFVSGTAKFLILYPFIAGVAVIVLASASRGIGRSIALMIIFLIPFFVCLASPEYEHLTDTMGPSGMGELSDVLGGSTVALSVTAWLGLLVGSRALYYRPASLAGAIIGAVGAGFYLITLFLPPGSASLASMNLVAPFDLMSDKDTLVLGLGLLGQMACLIGVSVLCIVALCKRDAARRSGEGAFGLLIAAVIVGLLSFSQVFVRALEHASEDEIVIILVVVAKLLLMVFGMLLLFPVGLADLIVNLSAAPSRATGYHEAVPVLDTAEPRRAEHASNTLKRLQSLKQMLSDGLITQEDYDRKKKELLGDL